MAVTMRMAVNANPEDFMEYLNGLTARLKVLTSPEEKLMQQKIIEQSRAKTWKELLGKRRG